MAKKTLEELQAQIEELTRQAEELKEAEKAEVIAEIQSQIKAFGLTRRDLFSVRGRKPGPKYVRHHARARRSFSEEQKNKLMDRQAKMVESGMTFEAAAAKLKLHASLLRTWYRAAGRDIPQRAA